jgi:hypothetical protein
MMSSVLAKIDTEHLWIISLEQYSCTNLIMYAKLNSMASVREWTIPSDQCLSDKLLSTFADRGCYVVNIMDPNSCILGFLDWSHYYFFQVAPQLYSRPQRRSCDVHAHCNNHASWISNASSHGEWFTCRNGQTRLAAEVFSLQLSVSLLSHLNLFFWSLAPTLQSVTRHGAADTSRWKQSNGSSESWRSTVPPSIQAAFTLGTRVLRSAAFTASDTASNRLPPHSRIYR